LSKENWVANVFVVNKENLKEAIHLAMDELAKADPGAADEWARLRLLGDTEA